MQISIMLKFKPVKDLEIKVIKVIISLLVKLIVSFYLMC
jgi:hypothetical protein